MSKKVLNYLIIDLIVMSLVTSVGLWLSGLCGSLSNQWIELVLKVIINGIWIIFDLVFAFFFLLYWWSDIKWTKTKRWARKTFKKWGMKI